MSLIKREPMNFLSRMQKELNHFFEDKDIFPFLQTVKPWQMRTTSLHRTRMESLR